MPYELKHGNKHECNFNVVMKSLYYHFEDISGAHSGLMGAEGCLTRGEKLAVYFFVCTKRM
jgi:hypothetical protein